MKYFWKIFKESIIVVVISSLLGLVSGTILSINEEILYAFPIILLLLPSLNSLIGDMSVVSISRLTSYLYIGIIPPKVQKSDRLKEDFIGLLMTNCLGLIILILFGFGISYYTEIPVVNPFLIVFVIILTILLLFSIFFVILFVSSIFLFKKGKDPNNFLIPFVTSLADFLTPLLLIIFIQIFI